jgi:glycogen debranching enzyme
MNAQSLRTTVYQSLLNLASEDGIHASGRNEVYGCVFGRDSAITILKLLKIISENKNTSFIDSQRLLTISKRGLLSLVRLQGVQKNIESGEEPGKFIHEYRTDRYEHLLKLTPAWYLYPDKTLRNYDSIDATPLALIAIYRYFQITRDNEFMKAVLPAVQRGLAWLMTLADKDQDGIVEYEFNPKRKFGGLRVQSWTDSLESLTANDGSFPLYPIAPVEVQGYVWLALRLWSDFYKEENISKNENFAEGLALHAQYMKQKFNKSFLYKDGYFTYPAQALDGHKNQIHTITGNPLLLLWATYVKNGRKESILETTHIEDLVVRSFMEDMFDKEAGIRTMSTRSLMFDPTQNSYHNGSFWPKLNGMSHEGLSLWGYYIEAEKLKKASLIPLYFFGSAIELYIKNEKGEYLEYKNNLGQVSCREQAWSAAVALDLLTL